MKLYFVKMDQERKNTLKPLANSSGESLVPAIINKELRHISSIEQAIDLPKETRIKNLILLKDQDFVEGILQVWILDLMDFFYANNPSKMMTENQVIATAEMIVDTYGVTSLNMADIKIIFSRFKKGHYGKVYGALNPPQIIEWIQQYLNERMEIVATKNYNKNKFPNWLDATPRNNTRVDYKKMMKNLSFKKEVDLARERINKINKKS